jgi:hypothetical protein
LIPVRAVAFDIGGVLEVPTDTDLEGRWEQRLGLYGLAQPTTDELLVDLWGWYAGELNTEMADYFQRLRPAIGPPS